MPGLPRPAVPDGPRRTLSDELHALHHQAGWPSLREMARDIGCSHTTVSTAFSSGRLPRWGLLELVVEALSGDTHRFHQLWVAASSSADSPSNTPSDSPSNPEPAVPGPRHWVPHELPADQSPFVGRTDELAELDALLGDRRRDEGPDAPGSSGVTVVTGSAGAGKTTTAVHWAHRVAERFPDGQIYLNLRGYDLIRPVEPATALEAVLGRLGVARASIPVDRAERAALYRTVTAGKRMLIVLDNAHCADQVRDLLPGSPGCFVLITSRDSLVGLVARHGADRVELDRLPEADAVALLARLIGPRAQRDPGSVAVLAERCARLPLALRIAAEVAAAQPASSLAELVGDFAGERRRLDLLAAGGDQYTAVRSVFSWSLAHLSSSAIRLFALGGLSSGRDVDRGAVVALGGEGELSERACDELVRAHLLEYRRGRYAMHDLLREYAVELGADLPADERRAAQGRLAAYQVAAASEAMAHLDRAAEREWLERERPNLVAAVTANAQDWPAHCLSLAGLLSVYLDERGYYVDAAAVQRTAVAVARIRGDPAELAATLNNLAAALRRTGPIEQSLDNAREALNLYRELGDDQGAATVELGIATVHYRQGHNQLALTELQQALALFRRCRDRGGEARALNSLGITMLQLGRLTDALEHHEAARALHREVGDRTGEGRAHNNVGVLQLRLGRYPAAAASFAQALAVAREQGNRAGVGVALANAGDVAVRQGRIDDAVLAYRQALRVYDDVGHQSGRADAERGLGVALARLGRTHEGLDHLRAALEISRTAHDADVETSALNDLGMIQRWGAQPSGASHRRALARAEQTGDQFQRARALDGLAHVAHQSRRHSEATARWQEALAIFERLGVPEADEIRAHLDDVASARLGVTTAHSSQLH